MYDEKDKIIFQLYNCLKELVELKDIKDRLDTVEQKDQDQQYVNDFADYTLRKKAAWSAARTNIHRHQYYGVKAASSFSPSREKLQAALTDPFTIIVSLIPAIKYRNDVAKSFGSEQLNDDRAERVENIIEEANDRIIKIIGL